jgi:hypothetical protein
VTKEFGAGAHAPALFLWELTVDAINANKESSSDAGTPAVNANSGNGVPAPAREQGPFAVKRDADQKAPPVGLPGITTIAKKSGGPRTKQGKEKSRRNAVKHGIFAKVVLLSGEPTAQFDNLLKGIRNDLQPQGTLEEVLVEKLAALMWRYRRMLVAERAEIKIEREHNSRDAARRRLDHEKALAIELSKEISSRGLFGELGNWDSQRSGIELLKTLQMLIALRGFSPETDFTILKKVFGCTSVFEISDKYIQLKGPEGSNISFKPTEPDPSKLSEKERRVKFINLLQEIIQRAECRVELTEGHWMARLKMELVSAGVPEAPRLDRILRYSASLERDFDRTLNQLERLQRMRRGQPATPTLNVNISG